MSAMPGRRPSLMPSTISTVAAASRVWAAPKRSVMSPKPDTATPATTPTSSTHRATMTRVSLQSTHRRYATPAAMVTAELVASPVRWATRVWMDVVSSHTIFRIAPEDV